ncbi:S1C family serine protease [Pontiella agarivorans]|uniref:Trypsin-like peptidase domain-containing protein n=1 Tax=Pontiella agarivorans TaxID=3038953 RepID=A0ABU5MXL6_9BACT|nr:trypsin-like peptidase domain-containing protein [Pontiella agarivorans]MDZ8118919.1 trypsin-like peptidase domain-containing protein [Pontiella agarivorans]
MKTVYALLLFAAVTAVFADDVILKGGAKIQAPVLKNTDGATVVDLGFDVLRIPKDEILATYEDEAVEGTVPSDTNALYNIQVPARITTAEAAELYAPSVALVKTASGLGSGFFTNKKGYLITNFHVIAGEKKISVTQFIQENKILRRVVHKDVDIIATAPFHDLAVLKINNFDTEITPVIFAPEEKMSIGEAVFAIGNPLGLERTVTEGVLSQTHRNFGGILYLQVDAAVNPGNSGGPLFNARGQVIGVINMGVPTMEGLNFAIPARHSKYILDHIDAFAYDATNPESGFVYPDAPRRPGKFTSDQKEKSNVTLP